MKRKTLLLIAALVALPGVTYADSPFSSLQSAHEKNTILKDLRKMCTPKGALTDEA
ncbi:HAD phosphatase YigL [Salmonella enterica subsp. enterica serovar Enteritidis]|nr:HAD phosphatase YigL [Salmonella enterica subsp. enterica serovar Enteritidis]